jgi:hypothetical protein
MFVKLGITLNSSGDEKFFGETKNLIDLFGTENSANTLGMKPDKGGIDKIRLVDPVGLEDKSFQGLQELNLQGCFGGIIIRKC